MVDATLKSRFLDAGVGVIPIDEGAQFFADTALRRSSATAIVVAAPAEPRLRATRLEWDVSTETLPVLEDHQVRGQVVVPVVIVLDAMLRAARGLVADSGLVVRDFQVLSGVTFAVLQAAGSHHRFRSGRLVLHRDGPRLRGPPTLSRHSGARNPVHRPDVSVPHVAGSAWPMSVGDAYAGPLFHGPRFAVIEALDVFGAAGGTARLKGLTDLGWPEGDWAIDPASVDGGLQLGILWASAHGHPLVLPMRIARVVLHRSFGDAGPCSAGWPRTLSTTSVSTSTSRSKPPTAHRLRRSRASSFMSQAPGRERIRPSRDRRPQLRTARCEHARGVVRRDPGWTLPAHGHAARSLARRGSRDAAGQR